MSEVVGCKVIRMAFYFRLWRLVGLRCGLLIRGQYLILYNFTLFVGDCGNERKEVHGGRKEMAGDLAS